MSITKSFTKLVGAAVVAVVCLAGSAGGQTASDPLPYIYHGGSNAPTGWSISRFSGVSSGGVDNSAYLRANVYGSGSYTTGSVTTSYVAMGANPVVSFKYKTTTGSSSTSSASAVNAVKYTVQVTKDDGATWTNILTEQPNVSSANFTKVTTGLPTSYANQIAMMRITFTVVSGDHYVHLDDVAMGSGYSVTFDANGGSVSPASGATDVGGGPLSYLPNPSRSGYNFVGWFTSSAGGIEVTTAYLFNGNATIYARWTPISYSITYNLNGGTNHASNPANYTIASPDITLNEPTRNGYMFDGWYGTSGFTGDPVTLISTGSTGAKTFWAKWTPVTYDITYNLNGGVQASDPPVSYNITSVTVTLPVPTLSGHFFGGWYEDADLTETAVASIPTGSTGNKAYWAGWVPIYTVTFDANGGSVTPASGTTDIERTLASLPVPTRGEEYVFEGWFTEAAGGTEVTESRVYTANTTIYAQWAQVYTVTFDATGGTVTPASDKTGVGSRLALLPEPSRNGYDFDGWFTEKTGGAEVTASTEFDGDVTVYAQWTPITYTITYNLNSGTNNASNPEDYTADSPDIELKDPARDGYTFLGWYENAGFTGDAVTGIPTGSTGGKALWAKWELTTYTVTYHLGGGTNHSSNPAAYTIPISNIALNAPTRTGYTFGGWYDNAEFTGTAVVSILTGSTGNRAYWARWTPIPYTVTYNLNSGTNDTSNPDSYTVESLDIELKDPVRNGYMFGGWYDNAGLTGTAVTSISNGSTGDRVFWARWTLATYTLSYTLNSGTVAEANPSSYNIETETFTLNNPARAGYIFTGWTGTNGTAPQAAVVIEKGSIGNRSYTANWSQVTSVLISDRTIPIRPDEEAMIVSPVSASADGFTAGPNIVSKASGSVVRIYRTGAAIGHPRSAGDNVLTVYDATGNIVNKISISDNAPLSPLSQPSPADNRRVVGSWDLRDAKGRPVSEGTYLLRGVVRTASGSRERVSLKVSVR